MTFHLIVVKTFSPKSKSTNQQEARWKHRTQLGSSSGEPFFTCICFGQPHLPVDSIYIYLKGHQRLNPNHWSPALSFKEHWVIVLLLFLWKSIQWIDFKKLITAFIIRDFPSSIIIVSFSRVQNTGLKPDTSKTYDIMVNHSCTLSLANEIMTTWISNPRLGT